MSNKSKIPALLVAGAMAFGLAGCASQEPGAGKPGAANIVQVAIAENAKTREFDYLLAAATCPYFEGAIVKLLSGKDRYTPFAPTDAAFEKLQRDLKVEDTGPGRDVHASAGDGLRHPRVPRD